MTSEFTPIGQLLSEPVGAVDAGDRLVLRKIQDLHSSDRRNTWGAVAMTKRRRRSDGVDAHVAYGRIRKCVPTTALP